MAGQGDNSHISFDAIVEENLRRGLLATQRQILFTAIRDCRLRERHRRVLVALVEHTNCQGVAYPGRAALARSASVSSDQGGYGGIAKTLAELNDFGYLICTRRSCAPGRPRRAV